MRDLLHLPYLHDSALLYHVRQRYFRNQIYTNIGPILLALNPYTYEIPHYKNDRMPGYIREGYPHPSTILRTLLGPVVSSAHFLGGVSPRGALRYGNRGGGQEVVLSRGS